MRPNDTHEHERNTNERMLKGNDPNNDDGLPQVQGGFPPDGKDDAIGVTFLSVEKDKGKEKRAAKKVKRKKKKGTGKERGPASNGTGGAASGERQTG